MYYEDFTSVHIPSALNSTERSFKLVFTADCVVRRPKRGNDQSISTLTRLTSDSLLIHIV